MIFQLSTVKKKFKCSLNEYHYGSLCCETIFPFENDKVLIDIQTLDK